MYFSNFPKIIYDFNLSSGTDFKVVTDITQNVRLRKQILENITLYDYYDIEEGETPEIISEKIYGTPFYHWVIMLANQRYDYINDFPLTQNELEKYIDRKYGDKRYHIHHYKLDGIIVDGLVSVVLEPAAIDGGTIFSIDIGDVLVSGNSYEARVNSVEDTTISQNGVNIKIRTANISIRSGNFIPGEILTVLNENTFGKVRSYSVLGQYKTTTNYEYEMEVNESKRRIKIIDPSLVEQLVKEFENII